jgi:hypothetical protein
MELCPPGGLKPVPPAEKLADFIKAVPTLNADWICPVLLDCLEDGQPWIIRAKALHVMEAALAYGQGPDGRHPYRDFFFACAEEIMPLASHPRVAISDPAKRVLQLLGVQPGSTAAGGGGAGGASTTAAAPLAAAAPAPNLLDFDEPAAAAPPTPVQPPASAPPAPPSSGGSSSMFGGMQVKGKPAASAPPAAAPVAAPSPAADLFDFGAPAPTSAPTSAPSPATPNDPFAEMSGDSSATPAAPSSMFAQMNIKDESGATTKTNDSSAAPTSSSGSAFGFINASEEKKTSTPAATPTAASSSSFDPTLLYAQSSAQPSAMPGMHLSPQQLQQLAYQNMLMQQQLQMAMMRGQAPPMPPIYRQGSNGKSQGMNFSMQQQPKEAKKDDKKFDFVKDAIISEKKH